MIKKTIIKILKFIHLYNPLIKYKNYVLSFRVKFQKNYYCPVCEKKIHKFIPIPFWYFELLEKYQFIHSLFCFETSTISTTSCSECGENDHNRLIALYFDKVIGTLNNSKSLKFIDFAPCKSLSEKIKKYRFINYRSADLHDVTVDDMIDIQDMNIYPDGSVDLFVCSHVLEHVEDDRKALKELFRILKIGGCGIIMAPILLSLENTYEDVTKTSIEDRWKYFGEGTHRRLYSKKDFKNRLKQIGFIVKEYDINFFGKELYHLCGLNTNSVLYVVEK